MSLLRFAFLGPGTHNSHDRGTINSECAIVRQESRSARFPKLPIIRVHAVGVGFADLMQRMGVYPDTPNPPFVPGFEVAGVIEQGPASSPHGKPLQVGERVVALAKFAAYADRVAVPAQRIFRLPAGISSEDAAPSL